jgi:tripartite-type tricarboxylate transporter receptor subunit TctC
MMPTCGCCRHWLSRKLFDWFHAVRIEVKESFVRALLMAAGVLSTTVIHAENAAPNANFYPSHPVRVIVPFAPGGPADIVARLLTQKLSEHLGKQFYVENQAGAGGNLGMGAAARAAPDGYTLVLVSSSYMVNPSLYPKVPYDQAKDFLPVTLPAYAPNVLVANPSLPVGSVKELAEFIKANPSKHSFASAGMGTTPYLSGELFKLSIGADLVHVPFNGSAPAIQSTLVVTRPLRSWCSHRQCRTSRRASCVGSPS